jgi:tetratricopeptide (TPR) repeat protein
LTLVGSAYFFAGNIELAVQRLRQARDLAPQEPHVHDNLGVALQASGDSEAAEESFWKAIEADPEYADAYSHLGTLLGYAGRWRECLAQFQKALNLYESSGDNEGTALSNLSIGWAHYKLNNWHESIHASEEALRLNDSEIHARYNLGLALLRIGEVERAQKEYEHALRQSDVPKSDAVEDLRAALAEEPTLRGAKEILDMLVQTKRS